MLKHLLAILCFLTATGISVGQTVIPLPEAHAHNDYEHTRPLLDALDHGFTSVEADIQLIDGKLYVGHDMPRGKNNLPTLQKAYLDPLRNWINDHQGQVYPGYSDPVYLMIDIKTDAEATYAVLKKILSKYQDMFTSWDGAVQHDRQILVFLSGNRPIDTILGENKRLVALDGRPEDLGKGIPSVFMPVISENYFKIIQWNGKDELSKTDFATLKELAKSVHAEGKKLRLWATPETETTWFILRKAGIDLLNTDQLARLQQFLQPVSKYVDLFIGTAGDNGQLDPAAQVPFGMVKLGPDTDPVNHSGYDYNALKISGFSHNRISGVGCKGVGGNIRILPGLVWFLMPASFMKKPRKRPVLVIIRFLWVIIGFRLNLRPLTKLDFTGIIFQNPTALTW